MFKRLFSKNTKDNTEAQEAGDISAAPVETTISTTENTPTESSEKRSWLSRLKKGLERSSSKIGGGIADIFVKRKLDDEALEELEELLIMADLGVATASMITSSLAKGRFDKEISPEEIKQALADEVAAILTPVAHPLPSRAGANPQVILMAGVNGNGKTTTIGKISKQLQLQGKKVMIAACDTFRAAAVNQLNVW